MTEPETIVEAEAPIEQKPVRRRNERARKLFRQEAERLNPSPFMQMVDGRGRPRRAPRHTNVKV